MSANQSTFSRLNVDATGMYNNRTLDMRTLPLPQMWTAVGASQATGSVLNAVSRPIEGAHGPEFIAEIVRNWIAVAGATIVYIEPGLPWENGYCDSFNSISRRYFSCFARSFVTVDRWLHQLIFQKINNNIL